MVTTDGGDAKYMYLAIAIPNDENDLGRICLVARGWDFKSTEAQLAQYINKNQGYFGFVAQAITSYTQSNVTWNVTKTEL